MFYTVLFTGLKNEDGALFVAEYNPHQPEPPTLIHALLNEKWNFSGGKAFLLNPESGFEPEPFYVGQEYGGDFTRAALKALAEKIDSEPIRSFAIVAALRRG